MHMQDPTPCRTPALTGWPCLLQTVVAAGFLMYGAVGAVALSTPKIAYKTVEVSCLPRLTFRLSCSVKRPAAAEAVA